MVAINSSIEVFSGDNGAGRNFGSSLTDALEAASILSLRTGETANVVLGHGDYYLPRALAASFHGLSIRGKGLSTRIHFTATTGANTRVPRITAGSFRVIQSSAIGLYVEAHRGTICKEFTLQDVCLCGLESTPTHTAQSWFGFLVAAARPTFRNIWIEQKTSETVDAANNSTYKSLNQRSVANFYPIGVGECKFVSPDTYVAFPAAHLTVDNVYMSGEPLAWNGESATFTSTSKFGAIHVRKATGGSMTRLRLSSPAEQTGQFIYDINFSSNPANNQIVAVSHYNPHLRKIVTRSYTFKNTPSGSYDVQRDGSTALATAKSFAAKIQANSIQNGGADYVTANTAAGYLNDATIASIRVYNDPVLTSTEGVFSSFGQGVSAPGIYDTDGVTTAGYASVRTVVSTNRRTSYYKNAIVIEDSPFVSVSDVEVCGAACANYGVVWLSTMQHNIFDKFEWSEGHHHTIDDFRGDGFIYGVAGIAALGSGFFKVGERMQIGQHGASSNSAPLFLIDEGNNKGKQLVLTSGNFANNDTVTINDGIAATVFTATTGTVDTDYKFSVGANATASLENLRHRIIERCHDKVVRAFCTGEATTGASSSGVLIVEFFSHEISYSPTITKSAANLTINDYTFPYRCGYATVKLAAHGAIGSDSLAAPVVKARRVYGRLTVSGTIDHQMPRPTSNSAQEYFLLFVSPDLVSVTDPATTDGFVVNGKKFLANSGSDLTPANTYYCGVPSGATAALRADDFAKKLAAKINSVGVAVTGASALYISGGAVPTVSVLRGATTASATFCTAVNVNTLAVRAGTGASQAPGATVAQMGARAPIVLDDCKFVVLDGIQAFPIVSSQYTAVNTFQERYGAPTPVSDAGNEPALNAAFGNLPMQLFYASSTDAGYSQIVLRDVALKGPWGRGRAFPDRFYDVGGALVGGDITVVPGCSIDNSVST